MFDLIYKYLVRKKSKKMNKYKNSKSYQWLILIDINKAYYFMLHPLVKIL